MLLNSDVGYLSSFSPLLEQWLPTHCFAQSRVQDIYHQCNHSPKTQLRYRFCHNSGIAEKPNIETRQVGQSEIDNSVNANLPVRLSGKCQPVSACVAKAGRWEVNMSAAMFSAQRPRSPAHQSRFSGHTWRPPREHCTLLRCNINLRDIFTRV